MFPKIPQTIHNTSQLNWVYFTLDPILPPSISFHQYGSISPLILLQLLRYLSTGMGLFHPYVYFKSFGIFQLVQVYFVPFLFQLLRYLSTGMSLFHPRVYFNSFGIFQLVQVYSTPTSKHTIISTRVTNTTSTYMHINKCHKDNYHPTNII